MNQVNPQDPRLPPLPGVLRLTRFLGQRLGVCPATGVLEQTLNFSKTRRDKLLRRNKPSPRSVALVSDAPKIRPLTESLHPLVSSEPDSRHDRESSSKVVRGKDSERIGLLQRPKKNIEQSTPPEQSQPPQPSPPRIPPHPERKQDVPRLSPVDSQLLGTARLGIPRTTSFSLKSFQERILGRQLPSVPILTNAPAGELARKYQSDALATTSEILMPAENFRPETPAGKALLAHELTHAISPPVPSPQGERLALATELRAWKAATREQLHPQPSAVSSPRVEDSRGHSERKPTVPPVFQAAAQSRSLPTERVDPPAAGMSPEQLMRELANTLRIEHERGG